MIKNNQRSCESFEKNLQLDQIIISQKKGDFNINIVWNLVTINSL